MATASFITCKVLAIFVIFLIPSNIFTIAPNTPFSFSNQQGITASSQIGTHEQSKLTTKQNMGSVKAPNYNSSQSSISQISAYYTMGDKVNFWVENVDAAQNSDNPKDYMYSISAILVNITENAYIFVDGNLSVYYTGLGSQIGQEFQTVIEPADTALGTPSDIDHNNRTIILIFNFHDPSIAGFFSPLNQYVPSSDPNNILYYSNYKEIININDEDIRCSGCGTDKWAPTLAHEFFHLIHYNYNPNEDVWLEEGLAVFAEHHAGFKSGYLSYLQDSSGNGYFLHAFDLSLTYFSSDSEHYGASFLFCLYLYQRFGLGFMKQLIQLQSLTGIDAIKYVLAQQAPNVSFEQVYSDWMITNVVNAQPNTIYSYANFSYTISQNQYDHNHKLVTDIDSINNKVFPYWSSEFYTLPQNYLYRYSVTFFPEIPFNVSKYQLTVITKNSNYWSANKIPLVNNQSGSFQVQYDNSSEEKLLIISSLTYNSSGQTVITPTELFTNYSSSFDLYLQPVSYWITFNLKDPSDYYPSYYFSIYAPTGEVIPENGVKNISISLANWVSSESVGDYKENITFDTSKGQWIIDKSTFSSLADGQYYFNMTISLVNGATFTQRGITFLIGSSLYPTKKISQSTETDQLPALVGLVLSVSGTIVLVFKYVKGRKKKN